MSYRIENGDLILEGLENGISDSPHSGINDMRGMNIVSIPQEACVSFAQTNIAPLPFVFTITSIASDLITPATVSGSASEYVAGQFTNSGGALPTGISASTTYWIKLETGGQLSVWVDCFRITQRTLSGGSGTNTFTSINLNAVRYFEKNHGFALDVNGRCWAPTTDGRYTFMNNSIVASAHGNGLAVYKGSGSTLYLFVFKDARIDYTPVTNTAAGSSGIAPAWITDWNPATGATGAVDTLVTASGTNNPHEALVGQDNALYYTDSSYLGSIRERAGSTFDPTSTSTYTFNQKSLAIPLTDTAQCLEELGTNLLVGGIYNFIYPWDRISSSFRYPILISEKGTARLLTVNTNCFIFAGKRGRVFVTNGSQATLYKKVPDHLLGIDPAFTFYSVGYNKNQLYFGVSAKTNAGVVSANYAGLWAVDDDLKAMRVTTLQSTATATVTAMWSNPNTTTGFGIATAWKTVDSNDAVLTAGIDSATSAPYTDYTAYYDTEILPVGTFLTKQTFDNLEFKLSAPLVSGEGVKIYYRTNLVATFTSEVTNTSGLVGETTTTGALSAYFSLPFEQVQWIQFRVYTKSTASSPSYVRLKELRLRKSKSQS